MEKLLVHVPLKFQIRTGTADSTVLDRSIITNRIISQICQMINIDRIALKIIHLLLLSVKVQSWISISAGKHLYILVLGEVSRVMLAKLLWLNFEIVFFHVTLGFVYST